jgi:hypothetical protein
MYRANCTIILYSWLSAGLLTVNLEVKQVPFATYIHSTSCPKHVEMW